MIDISGFEPLLEELAQARKKLDIKVLQKAVKSALRKTKPAMRKAAFERVNKDVKIKKGRFAKKHTRFRDKFNTNDINRMQTELQISNAPTHLIDYTLSKQSQPKSQKGIRPVSQRRGLKFRYAKGKPTIPGYDLFAARGKGNKVHVYRRQDDTKSQGKGRERTNKSIKIQTGPVVWIKFKRKAFRSPIEQTTGQRYQKEFLSAYKFHMDKAGK